MPARNMSLAIMSTKHVLINKAGIQTRVNIQVKVFNFGSINIDYVYRVPRFVQPGETLASESLETVLGGKGANQSVALARAGIDVVHLGRLGKSDQWAVDALSQFGVNTRSIELLEGPSGHAIIQVDVNGENAIVLHGGANQSFDATTIESLLKDASAGDWLLLQNECNALDEAFDIATRMQLNIAFNPAPMSDNVARLPLERCQVLILNEVEAAQLAGTTSDVATAQHDELINTLQQRYPDAIIALTLGSKGATLLHDNKVTNVSTPVVEVVDTTGAGDTFVGYFLAGLISGLPAEQALQRACAAGALAVTVAGATPGIPELQAVNALVNGT